MGFAIGVMWVGTSIQATGCVTAAGPVGACTLLPTIEQATQYAFLIVVVGFVAAFAAEYHLQDDDSGTAEIEAGRGVTDE